MHYSYFHQLGNETWKRCLPRMSILQAITMFFFNHRPRASSLPSSLQFWIAYATKKNTQQDGLTMKPPTCIHMPRHAKLFDTPSSWRPTHHSGRRLLTLWRQTFDIYCHWITSKQNLPTSQRDLNITSGGCDIVGKEKFTSTSSLSNVDWPLGPVLAATRCLLTRSHHSQGHCQIPTTLQQCSFPQRGQTGYVTQDLLSLYLLWMPVEHLRRLSGFSNSGRQPLGSDQPHHHRDHQEVRQDLPMGTGLWQGPSKRQKEKTDKTVPLWKATCELFLCSFSTYVELHCEADLPITAKGLSTQFGEGRCLWPHSISHDIGLRRVTHATDLQPGPGRILY